MDRIEKLFEEETKTELSPLPSTRPPATETNAEVSPPSSSPKKAIRRVVSISEFEQGTYQRMLHFQRKKQERIRIAQEEKAAALLSEVKPAPQINRASTELKQASIQERTEDWVKKREDWRLREVEARQQKEEEAESAELTFHPKITQKPRFRRTVEEFEVYLESTKDKHDSTLKRLKEEKEAKEQEKLVFKPRISQRSEKIMKNKGPLIERIEEASLMSDIKRTELKKKYEPSFRPSITPKSERLAKKRDKKQVFERLYRDPGTLLSETVNIRTDDREKETGRLSALDMLTKNLIND